MLKRIVGMGLLSVLFMLGQAQINAFDKGFDAYQRGKFDNAVDFYTIFIEDHESPNAYFNRGLAYLPASYSRFL